MLQEAKRGDDTRKMKKQKGLNIMRIKNIKKSLFSVFLAFTLLFMTQPATLAADSNHIFSANLEISQGNSSQSFQVNFEAGKAYLITAAWTDVPVFSGSLTGWSLQTASGTNAGDLIIKTCKRKNTNETGYSVQNYTGVFSPSKNMSELCLNVQGLVYGNQLDISVEEAEKQENLLLDATISVHSGTDYISAFFDVDFENQNAYDINAEWAQTPSFTDANEGKTAWKVQAAANSSIDGDDAVIYKTTAADNTAAKVFSGPYYCKENKPVFNFFSQRVDADNQIHLRVEKEETEPVDFQPIDIAGMKKLFSVSSWGQGFDIYGDTLFQCYDKGTCRTYDFITGKEVAAFQLGSSSDTNHCGNANFGVEFPTGNTQFPALYVSGDLTTKACYVENVTANSAELIQTIYFDIDPSYTGGQIIIDKERERILYMQRENPNIGDIYNVFQICEFRIPALSEGKEIHFTNSDIIGEPYELSYYSPLYQGAAVYQGKILQTHGLSRNSFGSEVGLMIFDTESHMFEKHIDLTAYLYREPQGVAVYEDRLYMNFDTGGIYEIVFLKSITATTPDKIEYEIGDELDLTGLVVTANYSDGSTASIEDYEVSGFDSVTTGEKTVMVTYQDKTMAFTVTVK